MAPKNLSLVEPQGRTPKPKPKPARAAWEEYKEAEREAKLAKRLLREEASHKGENAEMPRREQGAFLREVRLRQAVKQARAPVQAPQPVPEEKDDEMDEDVEEEDGTRETPIEVTAEVVAPREVPKLVEVLAKPREEEVTTRALPRKRDEVAATMWQWAGGPPNDKRRVVVDEGQARGGRLGRREDEKGEDEESKREWSGARMGQGQWSDRRERRNGR